MTTAYKALKWLACTAVVGSAPGPTALLVDVRDVAAEVRLDIRYATSENIAGARLYAVARCLLRPEVAQMVGKAQRYLDVHNPNTVLVMKDCYRPISAQARLFAAVKGTRRQGYVADPNRTTGAVHTYGAAVDVTLADDGGHELDMGTPFDFLGHLAEPRREAELVAQGHLSSSQLANRRLLRAAMVDAAGFRAIPNEWWHFDAWQGAALRARYERLNIPLEDVPVHSPSPMP